MEIIVTIEGLKKIVKRREYSLTGKTFLQGANGAGKSTVYEAMYIAINGRVPKGGKNLSSIMALCPTNIMHVGIKISGDHPIQIERKFKTNKKGKNSQQVFINGKEMKQDPANEIIREYFGEFMVKQSFSSIISMDAKAKGELLFELFGHRLKDISSEKAAADFLWEVMKLDDDFHSIARFKLDKSPAEIEEDKFTPEERKNMIKLMEENLKSRPQMGVVLAEIKKTVVAITTDQPVQGYLDALGPAIKALENSTQAEKLAKRKTIIETEKKITGLKLPVIQAQRNQKMEELIAIRQENNLIELAIESINKKKEQKEKFEDEIKEIPVGIIESIPTLKNQITSLEENLNLNKSDKANREKEINQLILEMQKAESDNEKITTLHKGLVEIEESESHVLAEIESKEQKLPTLQKEKEVVTELQDQINNETAKQISFKSSAKKQKKDIAKQEILDKKQVEVDSLKKKIAEIDIDPIKISIEITKKDIGATKTAIEEDKLNLKNDKREKDLYQKHLAYFEKGKCPICNTDVSSMAYDIEGTMAKITSINDALVGYGESVKANQDLLKTQQDTLSKLESILATKEKEISVFQKKINELESFISKSFIEKDKTDYSVKISKSEKTITKLKAKMVKLEEVHPETIEAELKVLKQTLDIIQKNDKINSEIATLSETPITPIQDKLNILEGEITSLLSKISELEANIEKVKSKLANAEKWNDQLAINQKNQELLEILGEVKGTDVKPLIEEEMKLENEYNELETLYECSLKEEGFRENIREWDTAIQLLDARKKQYAIAYQLAVQLKNEIINTMLEPTTQIAAGILKNVFPDGELVVNTDEWGLLKPNVDKVITDFSDGERVVFFSAIFVALLISSDVKKKMLAVELGEVDDVNINKLMDSLDAVDNLDNIVLMSFPRATDFARKGWNIIDVAS